ncbi:hypothetical protein BU17DRAFT_45490 [Hysterangium stoloniferum]|nr:hypothetical protein BU17DRAFT_45490 [Hysterangium stoloniferum]
MAENDLYPNFLSTPPPDFIIKSADGTRFQVHRLFLQASSSVFAAMLAVPQPESAFVSPPANAVIPSADVTESSVVMAKLLCLIYPVSLPSFDNIDTLSETILAADKYDIEGALSILRQFLLKKEFLDSDPVHVYGLASRFGWKEEKKAAFRVTLTLPNITDPRYADTLYALGASAKDAFLLLSLRQQRIDSLVYFLEDDPFKSILKAALNCNNWFCEASNRDKINRDKMMKLWRPLMLAITSEFSKRPLGDDSFWSHFVGKEVLRMFFNYTCACGSPMDGGDVMSKIRTFMDELPNCE